uniref:Uncharacterized protein n=1 Tax=Aegilops tauschii TaxID=37682 RepID=M8CW23_AEGTA
MTASEREMLAEDLELFVAEIPDHIVELLKKQSCATRPGEIEIDVHALDDAAAVELQEQKKMTASEREMLAEDLELFVAEIPDHIVELLKKQSCATRPGEIEIDVHALDDAAAVELQEQVNKFAREKRAANPSTQERHQDGPTVMAEEEEEDEEVDICGGVSPLAIVPQPLPQERHQDDPKAMVEEEEDVDICGGISPLLIVLAPLLLVEDETANGSPSSSSSSSDTDSSDSDSDTDSGSTDSGSEHSGGSDSDSDSDEIGNSPAPAITPPTCEQLARALERQRKEATSRAREKARQELLQMERGRRRQCRTIPYTQRI